QPNGTSELLIDVDWVVVARRARISIREVLVWRDAHLRYLRSGLQLAHCSHSPHDVGPGAAAYLLATLVGRDRLEYVVAASVRFGDVLDAGRRRDLIAGHDERPPHELLPAVHHHREVQLDLRVEYRRADGRGAVHHSEHRRCDDIGVPGRARGGHIEVQRVRLAHGERVLLDLLATHGVRHGLVGLADRLLVDGHLTPRGRRRDWLARQFTWA